MVTIAPSLLYKGLDNSLVIGTGTILESGPFWYSGFERENFVSYSSYGLGPGVVALNPIASLSEYLTTKIAFIYLGDDLVYKSLDSLAAPNSFKRYRKEVFLSLIKDEPVPSIVDQDKRHIFGKGFSDDIISLYLVWKLGLDWVESNYCMNVPKESIYLDMSFFEFFNSNNLKVIDFELRSEIINSFGKFGIDGFGDYDLRRLNASSLMRQYFLS